jgi:dephospho-CoA kinase
VAIDAVKLIQGGLATDCDSVWLVECQSDVQLSRLMARNVLTEEEASLRLAAQPDLAEARARADVIIENSGTREQTQAQVRAAWQRLGLDTLVNVST